MEWMKKINFIDSKEQFLEFMTELEEDFTNNNEEWENQSSDEFIGSVRDWIDDYSNSGQNDIDWKNVDWKLLARLFYMGKLYE